MDKDNTLEDLLASKRYIAGSLAYMPVGSEDYTKFKQLLESLDRKISDYPNRD